MAARLEVADGWWGRFMGLMGREGLADDAGLWLTGNGIHMMFMKFPIDAVFVGKAAGGDAPRKVLSVHRALRPWTGLVPMVRGAEGVLELPAGTIERTGTAVGDTVVLEAVEPAWSGSLRAPAAFCGRRVAPGAPIRRPSRPGASELAELSHRAHVGDTFGPAGARIRESAGF